VGHGNGPAQAAVGKQKTPGVYAGRFLFLQKKFSQINMLDTLPAHINFIHGQNIFRRA
jgi:hypothetical protein